MGIFGDANNAYPFRGWGPEPMDIDDFDTPFEYYGYPSPDPSSTDSFYSTHEPMKGQGTKAGSGNWDWDPFDGFGLPGNQRRATSRDGTDYMCTQDQIDSLQNAPNPRRSTWTPKSLYPIRATLRELERRYTKEKWWPADAAAAKAVQSIRHYKGPKGRDIVFKVFKDLDDALFGGSLMHRVRILWDWTDFAIGKVSATAKGPAIITLNAAKLNGQHPSLLGTYLHCLVHAFIATHTMSECSCSDPQDHTTHSDEFYSIISAAACRLGYTFDLLLTDEGRSREKGFLPSFEEMQRTRARTKSAEQEAEAGWEDEQRRRAQEHQQQQHYKQYSQFNGTNKPSYGYQDNRQHYRSAYRDQQEAFWARASAAFAQEEWSHNNYQQQHPRYNQQGQHRAYQRDGRQYEQRQRPQAPPDYGQHRAPPSPPPEPFKSIDQFNPYKELGVGRSAQEAEIMKAYKKLAMLHHPDKAAQDKKDQATEKMKNLNLAKDILTDAKRRATYDRYGTT